MAAVGYGYTTLIKGPAKGVQTITARTTSETDIFQAANILVRAARENQPSEGDCDTDTFVEPLPWRTPLAGEQIPAGGGLIPSGTPAKTKDSWGSVYGYCAWDHGAVSVSHNNAGCGGSAALRREGGNIKTEFSLAVISPGPDKVFQTACSNYVNASTAILSRAAGSDDIFVAFTYAEAFDAAGLGGGLGEVEDSACTVDTIGLMRYEQEVVQVCMDDGAGGAEWKEVGAATESATGFNPTTGVAVSSAQTTLNFLTFTGFFGTRLATVDNGGTIIVNGTPVGSSAQIQVGDQVRLSGIAGALPEETKTFTLKIGSIKRPWTLTTRLKTVHALTTSPSSITSMWVDGTSGEAYSPATNVTVTNSSGEDSAVMGVVSFSPAGNFEVTASTCTGTTLAPGQNCIVTVRAKASATAVLASTMSVASAGVSNPGAVNGTVSLSGDALFPVNLASGTHVNISSLSDFTTNGRWGQNRPKRVIIPGGVTIGSTSPSTPAMRSGTGWGGTLYITNNGSIQGAGGQPNGGQGGTAFLADAAGIQFINNGTIYGGGGAGGYGGTGGDGSYSSPVTVREPASGEHYSVASYGWRPIESGGNPGPGILLYWGGFGTPLNSGYTLGGSTSITSVSYGGYIYYRGPYYDAGNGYYSIYRTYDSTTTTNTFGGAGGNGGRGQGYDGSNVSGAGGSAGGTNAGTGGAGGTGGTWGNNGVAGITGTAGNIGSGGGGASGGLAGFAIQNFGNVTLTGSGSRLGQ